MFFFFIYLSHKLFTFTFEYYRERHHVTDVGMIMMETGMLAHNYNFEGTYKSFKK